MTSATQNASPATGTVYTCQEQGSVDIPLVDLMSGGELQLNPEVISKNYFRVFLKGARFAFQAGSYIGLIPITRAIWIDVRPKVSISNLSRILTIAQQRPVLLTSFQRTYDTSAEEIDYSLLDVFARSLLDALDEIDAHGLLRRYVRTTEDTSFPRGKISFSETMERHLARGVGYRATTTSFLPTVDTAANRCLKYAVWALAQRYSSIRGQSGVRRLLSELNRQYMRLSAVTLDESRLFLHDETLRSPANFPLTHPGYRHAIPIALALAENRTLVFDRPGIEVPMVALLIDLETTFEDYIRGVIRERLRIEAGVSVLNGNHAPPSGGQKSLFDMRPKGAMDRSAQPDVVIRTQSDVERRVPIIVEVKYKKSAEPSRDDLNQAIAYAVSYHAASVVIVSPFSELSTEAGLRTLGTIDGVVVYQYVFNLSCPHLPDEEQRLADALRGFLV